MEHQRVTEGTTSILIGRAKMGSPNEAQIAIINSDFPAEAVTYSSHLTHKTPPLVAPNNGQ